ncbi:MAG: MTH1187 family thiamine-binding protein [Ramlibacter sp.]
MAHPLFSRFRYIGHSLVSLSLLAGGAVWAQQAPPATTTQAAGRHMIAEIQVIPRPAGTANDRYKHVDAAIAVIQASGLHYEVHGMGTVIEGPPERIWPLLQAVHQATLDAGAERTLSIIKVSGSAAPGGPRIDELVQKFRK